MFPLILVATLLGLALSQTTHANTIDNSLPSRSLVSQAKNVPAEFEEYLFDVPLAVRIERNSQLVGEALVVLTRNDQISLLQFTDLSGSAVSGSELNTWEQFLKQGITLGACSKQCPGELVAVHYSLENSVVSILTRQAESDTAQPAYYQQPEDGSRGLIVRNQLNLTGGEVQGVSGRYSLEGTSSLGNWTQNVSALLARYAGQEQEMYHSIQELYTQRELLGSFFRLGYFTPSSAGLARQPISFGSSPQTALGVMYGSSDSLAIDNPQPSIYPIYVTANRQASVEIYRDGVLINTQLVDSGLRALDTRVLPSGIYDVEVRLVEDGRVTSATTELVYKPNNWRNTEERWRYNLFAGREAQLFSNWEDSSSNDLTAGVSINYLLHPRAIVGLSARQVKDYMQYGSSIDWMLTDNASLYANVYQTERYGSGVDLQSLYSYGSGSIVVSHARSWLDNSNSYETLLDGTRVRQRSVFIGQTSTSSISLSHRMDRRDSLNGRVSYSDGYSQGASLDMGWSRYDALFGVPADWRFSVFDRPSSFGSGDRRNRGFDLSLNLALGGSGQSLSGSIGSRTSLDGGRDNTAALTYRKDLEGHMLQSVSASAIQDTYGLGLSGTSNFQTPLVTGDAYAQRSSYNGNLNGGLNLESTIAVGEKKLVMTGQNQMAGAGMIIDLESDIEGVMVRADDFSGGSFNLRPGRNFVPLTAYKSGQVSFDFDGTTVPAGAIQPARTGYHVNKGGVVYRQIQVTKTLTVLGRLVDIKGQPLKGHHLVNHASRGVTEVDGFFSMEMTAGAPVLEVRAGELLLCKFQLDPSKAEAGQDILMVGDLVCLPSSLVNR
ncbi:TcfC E-set like domain-containing protein [Pseudomonas costantinii]|uniref:Outer membrane usher protein FimD/PapC n=1 Tax=Pseudomonas costantinii TaxID=168469 RepID=A0A1S2V4T1_9PSED|nr:TcfC E-set like domain-containing protein [Pseudomonas costantinii]OIN53166.1 pilus assembly protein PapC [Pseudomonas costantinii]SED20933.1 Outer membrane usher protein FimD/PapC [Pseudomonas costantinii]